VVFNILFNKLYAILETIFPSQSPDLGKNPVFPKIAWPLLANQI